MILKNKKILIIGDLRDASNWGAQLTSNALINWFNEKYKNADFKYITEKSWIENTPKGGFRKKGNNFFNLSKWYVKKLLWHVGILSAIGFSKQKITNTENLNKLSKQEDSIPDNFNEFESYWKKMLKGEILEYENNLLNWADEIFINSEGSIVNHDKKFKRYRRSGRFNLFMAWVAKSKYQKKTSIINHTFDPRHNDIENTAMNVYPILDKVLVREKLSLENLNKIIPENKNIEFFPDFAYTSIKNKKTKLPKKIICVGDSAGFKSVDWDIYKFYDQLFAFLYAKNFSIIFADGNSEKQRVFGDLYYKYKFKWLHPTTHNPKQLSRYLAASNLFISGRWHASILSLINETPVILFGSDSLKVKALNNLYGDIFPYFPIENLDKSIDEIKTMTIKMIKNNSTKKKITNINHSMKKYFDIEKL